MLYVGVIGVGTTNIIIALLYLFGVNEIIILIAILFDFVFFNIGPEPMIYLLFSELFPEKYKYKLNSMGYSLNWLACILSVFMMNWFLNGTEYVIYLIFATMTLFFGISGTLLCPETFNRSLVDIEEEIRKWGIKKITRQENNNFESDDENDEK